MGRLEKHHIRRIIKKTINEQEEDYDEDYYEEANEYANELNDDISNHILHYLQQCLGEIDINNLIYDNQQKFENKYGKHLGTTYDFLGIEILQQPIPKGGYNINDLSYSLLEELEKRMEYQSEHEDPDSLNY